MLGDEASVIVATTSSRGIAEDTRIPVAANVTEFHMPRYSMVSARLLCFCLARSYACRICTR